MARSLVLPGPDSRPEGRGQIENLSFHCFHVVHGERLVQEERSSLTGSDPAYASRKRMVKSRAILPFRKK